VRQPDACSDTPPANPPDERISNIFDFCQHAGDPVSDDVARSSTHGTHFDPGAV
jgi:hypothetical protein